MVWPFQNYRPSNANRYTTRNKADAPVIWDPDPASPKKGNIRCKGCGLRDYGTVQDTQDHAGECETPAPKNPPPNWD
ncbi:hypothetical protein GCM10009555_017080 [Acrocarpospora macrocephala]|uniref:Uncharacterized protein n=1 Tax=Acrocarpospora macrocephala TaxID=150177 RepID=A0A5M3WM37_9ACTN|nr:hypothetical protein [Acrocarpospora macrocephala]GES07368.1 hypothetical protein Amac_009630 [Acrocarpospora macrocephala]